MIGEPSKANGYELAPEITNAVVDVLQSGKYNTYTMSSGNTEAKEALAKK
jgi:phenylpyruvate tautomerase PptA (4-oxalocrotonate tautomerase family)